MGNTTASHPQQRIQERSRQATSQGQHQTRTLSLPPQRPPSVITALPDTDHLSSTDHPSKNVLAMSTPPNDVTIPDSPNSIMASAIPEVYYSNDVVHIDSPEPALSIDPSVPSYVSANGEISKPIQKLIRTSRIMWSCMVSLHHHLWMPLMESEVTHTINTLSQYPLQAYTIDTITLTSYHSFNTRTTNPPHRPLPSSH